MHVICNIYLYGTYVVQVPNHLSGSQKFGNSRKPASFENRTLCLCSSVQVFYTCTGTLLILNRLIKGQRDPALEVY